MLRVGLPSGSSKTKISFYLKYPKSRLSFAESTVSIWSWQGTHTVKNVALFVRFFPLFAVWWMVFDLRSFLQISFSLAWQSGCSFKCSAFALVYSFNWSAIFLLTLWIGRGAFFTFTGVRPAFEQVAQSPVSRFSTGRPHAQYPVMVRCLSSLLLRL